MPPEKLKSVSSFNWPLTGTLLPSISTKATLDSLYLNIARPPFERLVHKNIESTTYVSLPYHITNLFEQIALNQPPAKQDGGLHIGANVSPLIPDPYRWVHLNPGCLSTMVVLNNNKTSINFGSKNPFNRMTSSINKFLKMGTLSGDGTSESLFTPIVDAIPDSSSPLYHISHPLQSSNGASASSSRRGSNFHKQLFSRLLDFDSKSYNSRIHSPQTKKLLVSVNVNVVNVIVVDETYNYGGTKESNSTSSIFPIVDQSATQSASTSSSTPLTNTCKPYKRLTEVPLLRFLLHHSLVVTSILAIHSSDSQDPFLVMGLNTGDILVIDLVHMSYRLFDNLGFCPHQNSNTHSSWSNVSVTSLAAVAHPKYDILLFAGYANGEVIILDLLGNDVDSTYEKTESGKDSFSTYFKKFDLSPFAERPTQAPEDTSPEYIVGHFKVSHKPITSIASTLLLSPSVSSSPSKRPMIVALASDDGLVRIIDLITTHDKNYGDLENIYDRPLVSDIISNYFQDGVRYIEFSDDCKFFCLAGKGDLIEIFKMSYYNVSGLLNKNVNTSYVRGRSRSGTTNSGNSHLQHAPSSLFLSVRSSTPSTSNEFVSEDGPEQHYDPTHYPPMIKDITIVSRLKGHTNTVERVSFVLKHDFTQAGLDEGTTASAYNLISCGSDGKIIIWDFDSKAVSRVKRSHFVTSKRVKSGDTAPPDQLASHPGHAAAHKAKVTSTGIAPAITMNSLAQHARNRSWSHQDDNALHASFSNLGISNVLSPSPHHQTPQTSDGPEQQKIVISLYRSLYEVRLKKHYLRLNPVKDGKRKYTTIIHGIVDDGHLPSIQIPLLEIDLSYFYKDGKVQNFFVNPYSFWVFGRNGDIFRYKIE